MNGHGGGEEARASVLDGIRGIAREVLGAGSAGGAPPVEPAIGLDTEIAGAFDSLQLMALVVEVENRFEILLEPDDEERVRTVGDLVDIVVAKQAPGGT